MNAKRLIPQLSRRSLLQMSGFGLGAIAAELLDREDARATTSNRGATRHPHFPARARSVILLMQNGGPGQMDLFDEKPALKRLEGKVHVEKVEMFQPGSEFNRLLGGPFRFRNYGHCGMRLANVLPHIGSIADELCLVRSMYNYHNNHTESLVAFNTGKIFPGRPSLGSWITYALGSENQNLPSYIVLRDPRGYNTSGTLLWQNGWLPASFRGTEISTTGTPVLNLNPPDTPDPVVRRNDLQALQLLNRKHQRDYPQQTELEARIKNYELAARMQLAAQELLDTNKESAATREAYGLDDEPTARYGLRCLMARRLVESGVRFVQVFPDIIKGNTQVWDSHSNVKTQNENCLSFADKPTAALVRDLKQRGLLESTIVIWSGEFGRLPVSQNGSGRDHNRNAFSLLLAGGGFRTGHVHGSTDDVGYRAVEDRVSVNDLHATILHQLGLRHNDLTYTHHGRPETLTDAPVTDAQVVEKIIT